MSGANPRNPMELDCGTHRPAAWRGVNLSERGRAENPCAPAVARAPAPTEALQARLHGEAALPTLIYLPGLHGDWTLVSSFRAAVAGKVRFVEFTYPRTLSWTLADYADAILDALARHGIANGWLLGESFGSQVAWAVLARLQERAGECGDSASKTTAANAPVHAGQERSGGLLRAEASARRGPGVALATDVQPHSAPAPARTNSRITNPASFTPAGLILVGGFVKHPWPWGARFLRRLGQHMPRWGVAAFLKVYHTYAHFRHRDAPETRASIREFVERRTPLDSEAMGARLGLVATNDPRPVARRATLPVFYLAGLVDPLVPWPYVRWWLGRHCPGYRGGRTCWIGDHNALATRPAQAARIILAWLSAAPVCGPMVPGNRG